jgi:glycosyltransferase involved in cell wall biosynthesis
MLATGQDTAGPLLLAPTQNWRVLIAHPGRQHSHQAALALHEVGYLACYATGIPISKRQLGRIGRMLLERYSAYDDIDLPLTLSKLNMISPITNRLLAGKLPEYLVGPLQYEMLRLFDNWVARLVARQRFDAVIAYENSALYTFEAAKKAGVACILDAASLHHLEAAQRIQSGLPIAYKTQVDLRKDKEIALADCIFTASNLASRSYNEHVPSDLPIKAVALGADIERFRPAENLTAYNYERGLFTFIFVGNGTRLKGFDLLIAALERLLVQGLKLKMVVAGNVDRSLLSERLKASESIYEYGRIGHDELVSVLRNAHCLVLPSRLDSFGMVVPEAMACGLPVIVSDMVGAKQMVDEGQNGFVVPAGDVDALVDRMRWMVLNRKSLGRMAAGARAAAEQASWPNYRRRFVKAVREVLEGR